MGRVYLAEDTRLGRRIALKVVPPETAQDPERLARFEREARAVAGLSHPNIVVLHTVENADGVTFLTMEYVTGKPLSAHIPPQGMGLPDFLRVAVPLADAVYAAHKQGVTHRDLKPDNIMITDEGRVKVLDFGLAKLADLAPADAGVTMTVQDLATGEGKVLGTPAYMSPEQAESKPLDHRTDIFSLGIILFEMITGRRPFHGDTKMSTLTAVIRDHPPAVTEVRAGLPNHLGRVVQRCLAKDPDRRYQTALDVRNELETVSQELGHSGITSGTGFPAVAAGYAGERTPTPQTPPGVIPTPVPTPSHASSGFYPPPSRPGWVIPAVILAGVAIVAGALFFGLRGFRYPGRTPAPAAVPIAAAGEKSVVVFPFENLGPPEDAYFAAGITDEIMSRLTSVEGLSVLSRTTSVQFDRTGKTLSQVGAELGVAYVLEGTVRWEKSSDGTSRVRVAPTLVRTADDTQVWANRYERPMDEIFRIQSEIAETVVQELGVTLVEPERLSLASRPTSNIEAYHAYLRGLEAVNSGEFDRETMNRAVAMLNRAVELDPEFTLAYMYLAKAQAGFLHFNWDRSPERLALSKAAADRVQELAPDSPWPSVAEGYYLYWGRKDLGPALQALERAHADLPGNPEVLELMGYVLRRQGRFDAALGYLKEAVERDPRNGALVFAVAETHALLGQHEDALAMTDKLIVVAPDNPGGYEIRSYVHEERAEFDKAVADLEMIPYRSDRSPYDMDLTLVLTLAGRPEEAVAVADRLPEFANAQFSILCRPYAKAYALLLTGRWTEAGPWLEKALAILDREIQTAPDDTNILSALGIVHAGLGEPEDAIRFGRGALEAYPADLDAWAWTGAAYELAMVYMLLGELDEAIDLLGTVQERGGSYRVSPPLLMASPVYDPLRNQPGFKKLVNTPS